MTLEKQVAALVEQVRVLTEQAAVSRATIDRMAQDVHAHEQQLRPARGAPLVNRKMADQLYGPRAMRNQLGAGGEAPLRLAGLKGSAGDVQPASIPEVAALPQIGDTSVQLGTVLHHGGVNYRRGKDQWEAI